ncbi:MAG: hypothetical protein FWE64_02475 [Alphaproteobacteria bacterium]|nr:hypothetical protein [Alphaproteobacteria bacterium]
MKQEIKADKPEVRPEELNEFQKLIVKIRTDDASQVIDDRIWFAAYCESYGFEKMPSRGALAGLGGINTTIANHDATWQKYRAVMSIVMEYKHVVHSYELYCEYIEKICLDKINGIINPPPKSGVAAWFGRVFSKTK